MSDALDVLGRNLGGMSPEWFGDCIHVCAPGEYEVTLCGHKVGDVADVCSMDTGYKPNGFNGCWTCLSESNKWAERPTVR